MNAKNEKKAIRKEILNAKEQRKSLKHTLSVLFESTLNNDNDVRTLCNLYGVESVGTGYDKEALLHIFSLKSAKRNVKAWYPVVAVNEQDSEAVSFVRKVTKYYGHTHEDVQTLTTYRVIDDYLTIVKEAALNRVNSNARKINGSETIASVKPEQIQIKLDTFYNSHGQAVNVEGMTQFIKVKGRFEPKNK